MTRTRPSPATPSCVQVPSPAPSATLSPRPSSANHAPTPSNKSCSSVASGSTGESVREEACEAWASTDETRVNSDVTAFWRHLDPSMLFALPLLTSAARAISISVGVAWNPGTHQNETWPMLANQSKHRRADTKRADEDTRGHIGERATCFARRDSKRRSLSLRPPPCVMYLSLLSMRNVKADFWPSVWPAHRTGSSSRSSLSQYASSPSPVAIARVLPNGSSSSPSPPTYHRPHPSTPFLPQRPHTSPSFALPC